MPVDLGRKRIAVADVLTDKHRFYQAKVDLSDTDLSILDRRGEVLFHATGTVEAADGVKFTFLTSAGVEVTIDVMGGCGCGGTQVTDR